MIKLTPQGLKKSIFLETFFFILQASSELLLTSFEKKKKQVERYLLNYLHFFSNFSPLYKVRTYVLFVLLFK